MSDKNRVASASRNLATSRENNEYATPYELVAGSLRPQNLKARSSAVEILIAEFGLHPFDAETIARSVADLSQLKEAARSAKTRRYGQFEIQFIEVDVVTWRILPSLENIRFEGERAWKSGPAMRYETPIASQPVLGLTHPDPDLVVRTLARQAHSIWVNNPHSQSIPMRGIETPGLLSITRLALGDNEKIGILDATDGFSRTVGAQRGSGIDIDEVLFDLQRDGAENRLRSELIDLRDSGEADLDGDHAEVAAARLRSSVMPRAHVIVGYRKIGTPVGQAQPPFDEVRRSLVGHIHLEPPMPFLDSTENALKARIALEAIHAENMMPLVTGLTSDEVLSILKSETDESSSRHRGRLGGLHPDEVLLLAAEALISPLDRKRSQVVNAALYSLTGKKPKQKEPRAALAADTAMRVNRIALEQGQDTALKGRRSTLQKVLAASTLKNAHLTRRPILEIRDGALANLRQQRQDLGDMATEVSADAAELGVLGLYCLVEGVMSLPGGGGHPLLIRSSSRASNGEYMPEPQQVVEKMVSTEAGIQQLAQAILDVREGRAPRRLIAGAVAGDTWPEEWEFLDSDDLYRYKKDNWSGHFDPSSDPYVTRNVYRRRLIEGTGALQEIVNNLKRIELTGGENLVDKEGLTLENEEWQVLNNIAFDLRTWHFLAERMAPKVVPDVEIDNRGYRGPVISDEESVA